ncbi:KpsF/GutQ family sugar-phosphate isomerase [Sulfitobacter sp. F26169L]|uniref:KpsF/GutQ family sugar-phosphate isomerase n=1 Tax=Sulfitobacter sp. F26169L TaxID=2996015 RepID=UPI002260E757|nr:KpsF/GutQ family sugar-phosphate isomerase [Sulfitobacter sp. F26169L]MCX7567367.1 KpsF/GutQ family sugar-phosphate isomerase [Sulfitobacter sp. F26169L]
MPDQIAARDKILTTASQVLEQEGNALLRMSENLPDDFAPAVERILQIKGRIILSGIGKSGHIARKIASTLASTGTPAYFVHPAEASHGDLGMITQDDLCILLSNSGETSELGDLIRHTRRFSIPMIGMSSKAESTLMRAADLCLTLPQEREAGSGIAPTTSTTMALALGDALAMALMEQRGFLSEHFRTYHPGGKLGAQLALVHQLMHGPEAMAVVGPDTDMQETMLKMGEKGFGLACVIDDGELVGVISDGDLRRNIQYLNTRSAGEVATRSPKTVPTDMMAAEALAVMNDNKITVLVVVDKGGAPVGLLRVNDCLRAGVA